MNRMNRCRLAVAMALGLAGLVGCGEKNAVELNQKAQIYMKHGEYDQAIEVLKKSLDQDHENAPNHYYLGQCYEAIGKIEKAIYEYELAVRFGPSVEASHLSLIEALQKDDQVDRSVLATRTFVKNREGRAGDFIYFAEMFAEKGMPLQAIVAYERAQEVEPTNAAPSVALADFYAQHGDTEKENEMLVRAFKIDPNYPGLIQRLEGKNYRIEVPQPVKRREMTPLEKELKETP